MVCCWEPHFAHFASPPIYWPKYLVWRGVIYIWPPDGFIRRCHPLPILPPAFSCQGCVFLFFFCFFTYLTCAWKFNRGSKITQSIFGWCIVSSVRLSILTFSMTMFSFVLDENSVVYFLCESCQLEFPVVVPLVEHIQIFADFGTKFDRARTEDYTVIGVRK